MMVMGKLLGGLVNTRKLKSRGHKVEREVAIIQNSNIFDRNWYAERNSESLVFGQDPIDHYVTVGAALGLAPHPLFDVQWYVSQISSLPVGFLTVLGHFISADDEVGVSPHPLFDLEWYQKQRPAMPKRAAVLFHDFLTYGAVNEVSPHPAFNSFYYLSNREDLRLNGVNPLTHFVSVGAREGCNPNSFFDVGWYLGTYRDVASSGVNPLVHFLAIGAAEGRRPHPYLDLTALTEVKNSLGSPVAAYIDIIKNADPGLLAGARMKELMLELRQRFERNKNVCEQFDLRSFSSTVRPSDQLPAFSNVIVTTEQLRMVVNATIVSFDVWDTILRRECFPDEVKLQSTRYLLLTGYDILRPAFRDLFTLFRARLQSENAAAPNDEFEYRFSDALNVWLDLALTPGISSRRIDVLRQGLIEHELRAEMRSIRADGSIAVLLDAAATRAVFASDFYLPRQMILKLIESAGFGGRFSVGYVSCDTYATKRSGSMFERLLADLNLEPAQLVHVGDNPHADVAVPASKGIATVFYQSETEEARRAWYSEAFHSLIDGDVWPHQRRILARIEALASEQAGEHASAVSAGIRFAPVFVGFVLAVVEDVIRTGVDRVFFLTREGIFLRRIYEAVRECDPYNIPLPASALLAVSRRATFAASLRELSTNELMRLWTLYSSQSIKALARSLNLREDIAERAAGRYSVPFDEAIEYPWKNEGVKRILADSEFQEHANSRISEQRGLLFDYLTQEGFISDENGLRLMVDIGWRGTIQDNLAAVVPHHIRGHYLALFRFLNQQRPDVTKFGWLGDENEPSQQFAIDEVAPLEALANCLGGSVIGYRRDGDKVVPEVQIVAGEECAITEYFSHIQDGVLAAVPLICNYIRLHGLSSDCLHGLAQNLTTSMLTRPPSVVADGFVELDHNETFGTGQVDSMNEFLHSFAGLREVTGSALHFAAEQSLAGARWRNGAVSSSVVEKWWADSPIKTRTALPVLFARIHSPAIIKAAGARLSVYVPPPIRGSGGHRTIFNMVRSLAELGFEPHVFLEGVGEGMEVAESYLGDTKVVFHTQWVNYIPSDIAFATVAHSAQFVANLPAAHHRAYLVQDFEAYFNPVSDAYLVAEDSYSHGLHHFTIGNWLTHLINMQYGGTACPSGLGVDTAVYYPDPKIAREKAVCFLYQPDKPRRTPVRGIEVLKRISQLMPDVKIYLYGSDIPVKLDFPAENLGLVDNLGDLNQLYNRCVAGMCISGSNPSRIPYEMMASGCIPVDLYRYNNLFDHVPGTAILAYQGPDSIAAALLDLLSNSTATAQRSLKAKKFARSRTLNWEMDSISNNVLALLDGERPNEWPVESLYTADPYYGPGQDTLEATRFCDWQRQLAAFKTPIPRT